MLALTSKVMQNGEQNLSFIPKAMLKFAAIV